MDYILVFVDYLFENFNKSSPQKQDFIYLIIMHKYYLILKSNCKERYNIALHVHLHAEAPVSDLSLCSRDIDVIKAGKAV